MPRKRRYSDDQKRTALAILQSNAGDLKETERETGIPRRTLQEWRDGKWGVNVSIYQGVEQRKRDLALEMSKLIDRLLRISGYKAEEASLRDIAVGIGILTDKFQVLTGQPTSIVAKEKMTDEQLFGRLAELAKTLRERAALEDQKKKPLAIAVPPETAKNPSETVVAETETPVGSPPASSRAATETIPEAKTPAGDSQSDEAYLDNPATEDAGWRTGTPKPPRLPSSG
jgi:hypothetical protein